MEAITAMTPEEQFDVINSRDWYTAMRQQAGSILNAMQKEKFNISGNDSWIETKVQEIPVRFQIRDKILFLQVGTNEDGTPQFDWRAPIGWVM